jgi:hypothetical protein
MDYAKRKPVGLHQKLDPPHMTDWYPIQFITDMVTACQWIGELDITYRNGFLICRNVNVILNDDKIRL